MSITFLTNGLLATIQDLGRNGFRRYGINPNGSMDKTAARLINILLGNHENEAALELHFPAPRLLFNENAIIALGGADFGPALDGKEIENWRCCFVKKGSELKFNQKKSGNRTYIAVKGGFKVGTWLDSASTNLIAGIGRTFKKDDKLFFNSKFSKNKSKFNYKLSPSLIPCYSNSPTIRLINGAEFKELNKTSKGLFSTESFKIALDSNRMGFRLEGESLDLKKPLELVSSAVDFGTIQLLPSGQMIILMADHQTTGGYPRIGSVISQDLPLLAQLGANDRVTFKTISIEEAENLMLEFEKNISLLKLAVAGL